MQMGRFRVERGERTLVLTRIATDGVITATWLFVAVVVVASLVAPFLTGELDVLVLVLLGVYGLALSFIWGDRWGWGGKLGRLRKRLDVRPQQPGGYREGNLRELVIDGTTYDTARVREVTIRRIYNGNQRHLAVAWLVLDDRALVLDQSLDLREMESLAAEVRTTLGVESGSAHLAREPGTMGNIIVAVILMLFELAAMVFAFVPLMPNAEMKQPSAWALRLSPFEIAGVTLLFAILLVPFGRINARRRAKLLFGL